MVPPFPTKFTPMTPEAPPLGTVFTTRVAPTGCSSAPLVPATVKSVLPAATAAVVVTVRVDVPAPETEAGANDAEAPAGRPAALNATLPEKPNCGATVTV